MINARSSRRCERASLLRLRGSGCARQLIQEVSMRLASFISAAAGGILALCPFAGTAGESGDEEPRRSGWYVGAGVGTNCEAQHDSGEHPEERSNAGADDSSGRRCDPLHPPPVLAPCLPGRPKGPDSGAEVSLGVVRCHLGGPEGGTRYCGWAKPPHFFRGAGIGTQRR